MKPNLEETLAGLVKQIEAGTPPWRSQWTSTLPSNALTLSKYRGINTLMLWSKQLDMGYQRPIWATFKQWGLLGAKIKEGEKGTRIAFYKVLDVVRKDMTKGKMPMLRYTYAFNADQVEGYELPAAPDLTPSQRHNEAMRITEHLPIKYAEGPPSFVPMTDFIHMPKPEAFTSLDAYHSTRFHEIVHWTGGKKRLDRGLTTDSATASYAGEELIAEIGSAFLNAHCGITETNNNQAAYLTAWLSRVENKADAIFTAAKAANKAVEYIMPQVVAQLAEAA